MRPVTLQDWLRHQQRTHPRSIELGLARVRAVADALGLLPIMVPSAIVGGTNGKGSTATHLAALLHAGGWRIGLFTSPHLRRYNERVTIDGVEATDAELVSAFTMIEAARGETTLTYFEYNTLAALQVFSQRDVQGLVLEVGLGGRLDSTNVVDAEVAVLCSVDIDHTDWLGPTRESIGAEKAGIFRPAQPVFLADADMPDSVFARIATLGCAAAVAGRDYQFMVAGDGSWKFGDTLGVLEGLHAPALPGDVQYRNAATALAAARQLQTAHGVRALHDRATVNRGLAAVHLPGRFQVVPGAVEWIIDVAHNPAAARVLVQALRTRPPARRTLAVFGMLGDKDAAGVAAVLDPLIDEWFLCDVDGERGLRARDLRARMGDVRGAQQLSGGVMAACIAAQAAAAPGDRVLAVGSFHVAGPALDTLGL